jgi:hypothetical protein
MCFVFGLIGVCGVGQVSLGADLVFWWPICAPQPLEGGNCLSWIKCWSRHSYIVFMESNYLLPLEVVFVTILLWSLGSVFRFAEGAIQFLYFYFSFLFGFHLVVIFVLLFMFLFGFDYYEYTLQLKK